MSTTELVLQDTRQHAAIVAATNPAEPAKAASGEFLTFRLGDEEYGIDILCVQEIRSYSAPTRIANAPEFVKGVIDLRGVIVPIIDLRLKFGIEDARYDDFTVVVVLNLGQRVVGIVVDAVSDVIQLGREQTRPAPAFGQRVDADYLLGIGTIGGGAGKADRLLQLVDIRRLMSSSELGLLDGVNSRT